MRSCSSSLDTSSRRVPFRDELPVVDDADAVADAVRLLHVVRRVEDRHAARAECADALEDRVPALRIHADRRLVQHEQRRPVQQPGRDVQPAPHAAREGLDPVVAAVG